MTRRLCVITALLLNILLIPAVSSADITFWGYTGIAGPGVNRLGQVTAAGIRTNVASVDFAVNWQSTDLGSITSSFQAAGVKSAIFLDNVLYERVSAASSNCQDGNGKFRWQLRADWQNALASFASTNWSFITTNTTLFIVVFSEVNNACLSLTDVQTGASTVRSYFPGIPLVIGYGFDGAGGQPAPAYIPSAIDWVGFFKYGYLDPANPANPYNADGGYLNEFNSLVGKLSASQKIILVPDGFWGTFLHAGLNSQNGPGTGWPTSYLKDLALNYENFALTQPKVVGMILFAWPSSPPDGITGTIDLPQEVRDRHREIGCRNLGGCAPSYEGFQDALDCNSTVGWAWDRNRATPITVDVYDGTTFLGSTTANSFRQDLLNAGKGNGYHGFAFNLPLSIRNGSSHSISVKYGGTSTLLGTSPRTVTCTPSHVYPPTGWVDGYNSQHIWGWACDPDYPTYSNRVDVWSTSGQLFGSGNASATSSAAINNACRGGTAHYFDFYPSGGMPHGTHINVWSIDLPYSTGGVNRKIGGQGSVGDGTEFVIP